MNLWVKRVALGLTVALALFLFACLEEENLLGFKNQNQKFKVSSVEIPIESSVLLFDSLRTFNYSTDPIRRILVGKYADPVFGIIEAEAYTQLRPSRLSVIRPETAIYDSAVLTLQFDLYRYGPAAATVETFTIHELTERLSHRAGNNYFANTPVAYDAAEIGSKSLLLSAQRLDTMVSKRDTTVTLSMPLSDVFGQRLFDNWEWNVGGNPPDIFQTFSSVIKGLAITGSGNSKIVGFSVGNNSKVALHYHTDKDTLAYNFFIDGVVSASRIIADRTGTDMSGLIVPHQEFTALNSNKLYIQSGVPVVTKLNLSAFTDYFSNIEDAVITSAELSISNVDNPASGLNPPGSLFIQVLDNNNRLKKFRQTTQDTFDLESYTNKAFTLSNGLGSFASQRLPLISKDSVFTVLADTQQDYATLSYNPDNRSYKGFVTLFMQELYQTEELVRGNTIYPKTKFTSLVLYPGNPHAAKSVNRVSFDKDKLKLKIFYTTPITEE